MINCPYNNCCIKPTCDMSCSEFSEFMHWMNRCGLTINNPAIKASKLELKKAASSIIEAQADNNESSSYTNISVLIDERSQYFADLVSYILICKYCKGSGFYNGVYKLNYSQYIEEIKKSWNNRYNSETLEDIDIWIRSSKFLVISNLSLVRFGDFESQTLLSIFQERYDADKITIVVLEKGKFSLLGKSDSAFYAKLKNELTLRGAKI